MTPRKTQWIAFKEVAFERIRVFAKCHSAENYIQERDTYFKSPLILIDSIPVPFARSSPYFVSKCVAGGITGSFAGFPLVLGL
jgi:hypothetical protein